MGLGVQALVELDPVHGPGEPAGVRRVIVTPLNGRTRGSFGGTMGRNPTSSLASQATEERPYVRNRDKCSR